LVLYLAVPLDLRDLASRRALPMDRAIPALGREAAVAFAIPASTVVPWE